MKLIKGPMLILLAISSFSAMAQTKFKGTFSNGYKGAKISFTLSADGKYIQQFIFDGYWRCGNTTEHITAGPAKSFKVIHGKIQDVIVDPENGGASAFRFNLEGLIKGKQANGSFRMSIAGLSCDTYKLNWTATAN